MAKIHLASRWKTGVAVCHWNENQTLTLTEDISEVTCRRCLSAMMPADIRTKTTEELRELATKHSENK